MMHPHSLARALAGCGVIFVSALAVAEPPFSAFFEDISSYPGAPVSPTIYAISPDGTVVVGSGFFDANTGEGYLQAVMWSRNREMIHLGDLKGGRKWGSATAVSNEGRVIVGTSEAGFEEDPPPQGQPAVWTEAFRWTQEEGMTGLGNLATTDRYSEATGISADGLVIAGNTNHDGLPSRVGFRWTQQDGMTPIILAAFPMKRSYALGISADGLTIAGEHETRAMVGFRWAHGSFEPVGEPLEEGFTPILGRAASADGGILVGKGGPSPTARTTEAFHWSGANGYVGLGGLTEISPEKSEARAVSADGSVVVGQTPLGAFIWTARDGLNDLKELLLSRHGLDLGTAWKLDYATGISADGRTLVGYGQKGAERDTQRFGWILRMPLTSGATFRRAGDVNQDAQLNISDVIWFLNGLFVSSDTELPCDTTEGRRTFLDINQDNRVDIADPISLAIFLFVGGPPPLRGAVCAVVGGCEGGPGCKP